MEWTDVLHDGANSGKLKVVSLIVGNGMVKNGCDQLDVCVNWAGFLHADCDAIIFG